MVVFLLSSNLAKWYNTNRNMQIHDGISGMVALASYIAVSLPAHATSLPFEMAGVNGLLLLCWFLLLQRKRSYSFWAETTDTASFR